MASLYRIQCTWTGVSGAPFFGGLHFLAAGGTAQQAADAARAFWIANQGQQSSSLVWNIDPVALVIESTTGKAVGSFPVTGVSFAGASASELLPGGINLVVNWRTGIFANGREVKGRSYLPGMVEANNGSTGQPDSTVRGAADTGAANLVAHATSELIVYRRTALTFATVASGSSSSQWSHLRTRQF